MEKVVWTRKMPETFHETETSHSDLDAFQNELIKENVVMRIKVTF